MQFDHIIYCNVVYLHGESSGLLIIVIQKVGHEGGIVGEALAHP